MRSNSRRIGQAFAVLGALAFSVWMFGALVYDGPGVVIASLVAIVLLAVMAKLGFHRRAWIVWGTCMVAGLAWWLTLTPPVDDEWQADVAQVATAKIDGDVVTFHNVRDFEYRSATDFTPRWITREVKLSSLTGVDIAINYWGSPWMAHPIVSFRFSDSPPLAFSIETRKRVGQSYSAIGGLYRQYSLACIVAEERDVLGVRAVHRKGEDVYLYRTILSPEKARTRLLEYIATINSLAEKPRWYNAITTNCTTAIRSQHTQGDRIPWDWRILVNGKGDEMMFEQGMFESGGLTFPKLKQRAHANTSIIAADGAVDFSARIREDIFPKNP
jgi:Domain of unknown function (DUF4105)